MNDKYFIDDQSKDSVDDENSSMVKKIDSTLQQLGETIEQLLESNVDNKESKIQRLKVFQERIEKLVSDRNTMTQQEMPYYQKLISECWDELTSEQLELNKNKLELENIQIKSEETQEEEFLTRRKKKELSNKLKYEEKILIKNQNHFNKNGKSIDSINSKIEFISNIDKNQNDTFLNNLFNSNNIQKTKKLGRILSDREKTGEDLVKKIQIQQEKILNTADDIDFHNKKLTDLQTTNIELRQEIKKLMDLIKGNTVKIKKTEKEINDHNKVLKLLSSALVDIANESAKQHSIYKKSLEEPSNSTDFEILLDQAMDTSEWQGDILSTVSSRLDEEIEIPD